MSAPSALVVRRFYLVAWMVLIASIPERELEQREDLRSARVFTIDPPTAKDLDDALDISRQEDGTFRVRVHIADVSYFGKLFLSSLG